MKNATILAVILAVVGSAANAESAVNEAPLALALNNSTAISSTVISNDTLGNKLDLETAKRMEKISIALGEQLENKIAKELEYVMH